MTSLQEQARALGDPTRHRIFRYLVEADHPVGVAEVFYEFERVSDGEDLDVLVLYPVGEGSHISVIAEDVASRVLRRAGLFDDLHVQFVESLVHGRLAFFDLAVDGVSAF